jgi:hypothetical protein
MQARIAASQGQPGLSQEAGGASLGEMPALPMGGPGMGPPGIGSPGMGAMGGPGMGGPSGMVSAPALLVGHGMVPAGMGAAPPPPAPVSDQSGPPPPPPSGEYPPAGGVPVRALVS